MLSRIKAWFGSSGDAEQRERLSDYRMSETLGKGAMSEVKKAFHKKTFRAVAIKLLTLESRSITAKIEQHYRHMTEGEVAMLCDHPNVIKTYGWGKDGKSEFIVMALFEGVLLRDLLHEGRFNPAQNRMSLFSQMTSALAHIHSKGVVHRDFCPRNMMVNTEGLLTVFDFGLSVDIEMVKHVKGNRTGTLAYMAPELIKRQFTDQRCDIYALGITMYEMFAGQRPFLEIDNIARLMQLMNAVPDPPSTLNPDISPEFDKVILKAVQKDPNDRYETVAELMADMEPIMTKEHSKWNVSPPTPDTAIFSPNANDIVA